MTNIDTYVPEQHSAFSGAVASLFSIAILAMAGVVAFTVFLNI